MLAAAFVLRALRVVTRWHEDAWLYAAYPSDTVDALARGQLPTAFTGLHPPAWPLLHALSELLLPVPLLWLSSSALLSLGAVVLLARRSVLSAAVLATAPVAVHYAAEVNQYALLTFALAGLWSRPPPRDTAHIDLRLVAWGALAGWTHILGAIAALLALVTLPHRSRLRTTALLALALSPLAVGVFTAAAQSSTFSQPPLRPTLIAQDWLARFGVGGLLLTALLLRPARDEHTTAVVGSSLFIVIFIALGVAAPHQFPYWLVPLPALALLASSARWPHVLVGLCVLQAAWQLAFDSMRVQAILADLSRADRAVDVALSELSEPWTCSGAPTPSCSGDALVLLRPPGRNDDDKTRTSSVLWRIEPWRFAPRVWPTPGFDWADHRLGQPRLVHRSTGLHVVYVHDHLRPSLARLTEAHHRVWLVVSEPGQHAEYTRQLDDLLQGTASPIGADRLYRLQP